MSRGPGNDRGSLSGARRSAVLTLPADQHVIEQPLVGTDQVATDEIQPLAQGSTLAERTAGQLLVTASRGHFPEHIDHRYDWSADGAPRHEWCVARSRSILCRHLGFTRAASGAVATGEAVRPELTFLSASR